VATKGKAVRKKRKADAARALQAGVESGVEYWRARRGLGRLELAKRAKVAPGTVLAICRGELTALRPRQLEALAQALAVSVAELLSAGK